MPDVYKRQVQAVVHIKVEGEQTIDYIDPFEFFFGGGRGFALSLIHI